MSKGLKALEMLENDECILMSQFNECYKAIEKELKALEIIKPLVDLTKEQKYCWLWLGLNGRQITQEQYDLLKEVLL